MMLDLVGNLDADDYNEWLHDEIECVYDRIDGQEEKYASFMLERHGCEVP